VRKIIDATDGKYAPKQIMSEIGKEAKLNPRGVIEWLISTYPLFVGLRPSIVVINPENEELNETDSWQIISKAIDALVKKSPGNSINHKDLLFQADKIAATYFRANPAKYILISSLSVTELPAKTIKVNNCLISALGNRGSKYPLPKILSLRLQSSTFPFHIESSKYKLVKVSTVGRSEYEAIEKALNALNILRGIWSLFATKGAWSINSGVTIRKPLGIFYTGPFHTLHHPNGKPVNENMYWYDPDFTEDQIIFQDIERLKQIDKKRKWAMRKLMHLEYRKELESLLIRYVEALDQPNTDIAFLQMWSILEKITNTVGSNYDETIKRTTWLYTGEDCLLAKNVLESLRYRRNHYVHSGKTDNQESDQIAYLIKSFIDPHLFRLIANKINVRSIEEYGDFLSLPTDIATLKKNKKMIGKALRVKKE
jgi:hypothetical protein